MKQRYITKKHLKKMEQLTSILFKKTPPLNFSSDFVWLKDQSDHTRYWRGSECLGNVALMEA